MILNYLEACLSECGGALGYTELTSKFGHMYGVFVCACLSMSANAILSCIQLHVPVSTEALLTGNRRCSEWVKSCYVQAW